MKKVFTEKWKDIEGYEGIFQISNFGRVKSIERDNTYINTNQTGKKFVMKMHYKEKILKTFITRGYEHVSLKKNYKSKSFSIHRLVAMHFIPNPKNYKIINHKDENKLNNRVDNLEWCDHPYNANYGTRNQRIKEKLKNNPNYYIPVSCYTLDNKYVKDYESAVAAGNDIGISPSLITACCRLYKSHASAGGFKWKYKDSDLNIETIAYRDQKIGIVQADYDGRIINTIISISDAASSVNKNLSNFASNIKKGYAYGFIWITKDNENNLPDIINELEQKKYHLLQIDSNGNVIKRFQSSLEAEKEIGIDHSNILFAINSKTKEGKYFRKAKGYYWVDINETPDYQIDFQYKKNCGQKIVQQYDLQGNLLKEFPSVKDAQESLGIDRNKTSSIYDCLSTKKGNSQAYGFVWKYKY